MLFLCRNCKHSATDHSSKTGTNDLKCHMETCTCEQYSSVFLDMWVKKGVV